MNPEEETLVAIAVVRHGEDFLVGRRGPEGPLPNAAEFPGGKCKPDESVLAAAERECLEETGIPVRAATVLLETAHAYPHGRLRLVFVACEPLALCEPMPPFRWVRRGALTTLPFPEANQTLVKRLAEGQ